MLFGLFPPNSASGASSLPGSQAGISSSGQQQNRGGGDGLSLAAVVVSAITASLATCVLYHRLCLAPVSRRRGAGTAAAGATGAAPLDSGCSSSGHAPQWQQDQAAAVAFLAQEFARTHAHGGMESHAHGRGTLLPCGSDTAASPHARSCMAASSIERGCQDPHPLTPESVVAAVSHASHRHGTPSSEQQQQPCSSSGADDSTGSFEFATPGGARQEARAQYHELLGHERLLPAPSPLFDRRRRCVCVLPMVESSQCHCVCCCAMGMQLAPSPGNQD